MKRGEYRNDLDHEERSRVDALVAELDCKLRDVHLSKRENEFIVETCPHNSERYLVLTDEEADAAFEQSCDRYIEDNCPEEFRDHLNREAYRDAVRLDGRGHELASDGCEQYTEGFYIYKQ